MSVTDLSVMVVDEFVPTETSYIVIRYNRDATQIKDREGQPEASTRVHVVCTLLRGKAKKEPPPLRQPNAKRRAKKVALTRWRFFVFYMAWV